MLKSSISYGEARAVARERRIILGFGAIYHLGPPPLTDIPRAPSFSLGGRLRAKSARVTGTPPSLLCSDPPPLPTWPLFNRSCGSFCFHCSIATNICIMTTSADASTNSRFQHHVSFDNFAGGEPTEKNTISFTLNVKHKGYQFKRRSRSFYKGFGRNAIN